VLRTVDTVTPTFAALRKRLRAILRVLDAESSMNILLSTEE
jgi:diphthamide synthase subunit DPH2